jgi:hypothetical protein
MRSTAPYRISAVVAAAIFVAASSTGGAGRCGANSDVHVLCGQDFVDGAKATLGIDNNPDKAQSVGQALQQLLEVHGRQA